jgi:hypothetical protein
MCGEPGPRSKTKFFYTFAHGNVTLAQPTRKGLAQPTRKSLPYVAEESAKVLLTIGGRSHVTC